MILLTVTEFRSNISKYLQMAFTEKVALKSKRGIIELNPSTEIRLNPSPSNDPYFDDPRNLEAVETAIANLKSGKAKLKSWDEVKASLGI